MVKVFCKNSGETKEFQEGSYLYEIVDAFDFYKPYPILAAKVNNVVEGLKFRVFNNRDVEFLDFRSYAGRSVYNRSLCFLLSKACQDICPGSHLTLHRPISKGFYCKLLKSDGTNPDVSDIEAIRRRMRELIEAGTEFHRHEVHNREAIELFRSLDCSDKVKLLSTTDNVYVRYYTLEGTADIYYDALLPNVGYLKVWSLEQYREGLFLRVPDRHNPESLAPFFEQPKTFEALQESLNWNRIMGLNTAGDVNLACADGRATELINIAEALQMRKLVHIAEDIKTRHDGPDKVKLVLITGPSSSGKSTVCDRLSTLLTACGLRPVSFSTDDYFVNRLDTPRLPDGSFDFDNFDTVDHVALQEDMIRLLRGERVQVPQYNFITGIREYNGKTLELNEDSVLLIEGIHALNPALTDKVPDNEKFKIFINTITSVNIDDHNCVSTSDNRLLRRIIRDFNKGAFTARDTIRNWHNVRKAEVKWIYPYQESADVLFNSAYLMEFAALRRHGEQVLSTVPKDCPEYSEAHRLLKFLQMFTPVCSRDVPETSLLRGFIGGGRL